jgi:RecJ-like exonuclease
MSEKQMGEKCPACEGSGYSPDARKIDSRFADVTFDALERHALVKAECATMDIGYRCTRCNGDGHLSSMATH